MATFIATCRRFLVGVAIVVGTALLLSTAAAAAGFGSRRRSFGVFSAAVATTAGSSSESNEEEGSSLPPSLWLDHHQDRYQAPSDDYHNTIAPDADEAEEAEPDQDDDLSLDNTLQLHPLLQIPATLALSGILYAPEQTVRTFVDTGAMRTVMSWDMAKRLGVVQHVDRRYVGQAAGIGSCRVVGRLPAGLFVMHLRQWRDDNVNNDDDSDDDNSVVVHSPAITILENTGLPGVELLLGLDFLREYQAILDLRREEIRLVVDGVEHAVPFCRPQHQERRQSPWHDDDDDDNGEKYDLSWHCRKKATTPTNMHDCDMAPVSLYNDHDDRYWHGDEESEEDEEDWPDMSGV